MKPVPTPSPMPRPALLHGPRRAGAFTLVELLVAVLFLCTVVALAVPRFWNSGSEARTAKQQALFGAVQAGAQITRAAAQVHNQTGPTGEVTVDGVKITTVFGYPAATAAGIVAATGLDSANDEVSFTEGGMQAGSMLTVAINSAHGTCTIRYVAPVAADEQPGIDYVNSDGKGGTGC